MGVSGSWLELRAGGVWHARMLVLLPRFDALASGSTPCRLRAVQGAYASVSRRGAERGGLTLRDWAAASPGCWGAAKAGWPQPPSPSAASVKTSLPVSRGAAPPLRPPCHPTPARQSLQRSPPRQLAVREQRGASARAAASATKCTYVPSCVTSATCL